jgi:hypothetical protein
MERFIGLILVSVCLAAGFDLAAKPARPSASYVAGFDEAGIVQKIQLKAWVFSQKWECFDMFIFRVAKTEGVTLVQIPFTGGLWYKA